MNPESVPEEADPIPLLALRRQNAVVAQRVSKTLIIINCFLTEANGPNVSKYVV